MFISSSSTSGLSRDQFLEDGVGGDDPGDGDDEASPDGHVGHTPTSKQDPSHCFTGKCLWQNVCDISENCNNCVCKKVESKSKKTETISHRKN
jgi:hypothetical protein